MVVIDRIDLYPSKVILFHQASQFGSQIVEDKGIDAGEREQTTSRTRRGIGNSIGLSAEASDIFIARPPSGDG